MKKITKEIIILVSITIAYCLGYVLGHSDTKDRLWEPYGYEFKMELLDEYDKYYESVEILLDSVVVWDESFMDTTLETDVYFEYYKHREKIDSLYETQL